MFWVQYYSNADNPLMFWLLLGSVYFKSKTIFLHGRGADLGSGRGSGISQSVVSNCTVHNLFPLVLVWFSKSLYYCYYLILLLFFSFASITKLF